MNFDYFYAFSFLFFSLGLCIGSFLNVLIYRLPRGINVVFGRSFCPKCKREIRWFDNIPLFSYFMLLGRCRYCHSPISVRYPIVELATGVLTLLILNFKFPFLRPAESAGFEGQAIFNLIYSLFLVWGLIVIFFVDLEHQIIPDEIVLPLIGLFSINLLISYHLSPIALNLFLTATASSLFFLLLFLVTRGRGMGFGDVKLAFLMGLVLGFPKIIIALYLAFLTGALVGVILILVKKAKFGQKIAFGPFLVFSTIICLLWGEKIFSIVQKSF